MAHQKKMGETLGSGEFHQNITTPPEKNYKGAGIFKVQGGWVQMMFLYSPKSRVIPGTPNNGTPLW